MTIDWPLAVTIWFVCAVFCALVAPRKGDSPSSAFVLGLLLGPIGVALMVIRHDKPQA